MTVAAGMTVDVEQFVQTLRVQGLSVQEMLDIRGAGAKIIINKQRELVPVDTSATKNSIKSHIVEKSETRVVDDIGPETEYAPYLEYGTGEQAESGQGKKGFAGIAPQPFIRPSIVGNESRIQAAISAAFKIVVEGKWPK